MRIRLFVFSLLTATVLQSLAGLPASGAGPLIIGVRGGVPFTDVLESVAGRNIRAVTKDYVVGPTLGVNLPLGFSVEADALYQRVNVDASLAGTQVLSVSANAWQFPVMLKFARGETIAPFIGAGVSVRHLEDFGNVAEFIIGSDRSIVKNHNTVGFVIGGGLNFHVGPLRISPEIRYTRWGSDHIRDVFRQFLTSSQDDAQFVLGFTF